MRLGLPAYYYPTTVIMVDDSEDFLTNFSLQLQQKVALKLFSHPHSAMSYIKNMADSRHVGDRSIVTAQESSGNPITHHTVTLNLASIQREIYNPNRFFEITVVIVDYDMPEMNGLEFCRKLIDSPIRKILLTGKGDDKVAVKAFNEGLIDHFIQKSNHDVIKLINQNIASLQHRYFQQMTESIRMVLSQESSTFVTDPIFKEFFCNLCKEHNFTEYYLTELTGSFLLLDSDARPSLLIVKCYEDLNIHYEFAQDNGAPESVLEDIRSGNKIPFAWNADDYFHPHKDESWGENLFPAKEIKGNEVYYYTLIKDPQNAPIDMNRVISYNQFLKQSFDQQTVTK
jgi:CheY-like chemotaxis protein